MTSNELRIGNFIQKGSSLWKVTIGDLYNIQSKHKENKYKPIPLTEEWLLKLGFGKSDEHELGHNEHLNFGFYFDYHFHKFRLECDDPKNSVDVNLNIKYVHQLQNLYFALTEEELTINEPL